MNPPLSTSTSEANPAVTAAMLAGRSARLLSGLLLGVTVAFAAAGAHAAPLITGCCDSITHSEYGPGYLPLIQDVYGAGQVEHLAFSARTSYRSMYGGDGQPGLGEYLGVPGDGVDPEVVILLAGTPDPFWNTPRQKNLWVNSGSGSRPSE